MAIDTYKFARNTGDAAFLQWIYLRLQLIHHEKELLDYMHTLKAFVLGINTIVEDADRWNSLPKIVRRWYGRR